MEVVIKLNEEDIAKGIDLSDLLRSGVKKAETKKAKQTKKEEPAPVEQTAQAMPEEPAEKPVTKADVRAKALEITKAGKSDELKAVFDSFGVSKLSELKESDYADCLAKLQEA